MLVSVVPPLSLVTIIRSIFIIAEQDLHRTEVFSTFCAATLARRLGRCGEAERRHSQER